MHVTLSAWTTRVVDGVEMPVGEAKVEIWNCRMESTMSKANGDRKTHQDIPDEPISIKSLLTTSARLMRGHEQHMLHGAALFGGAHASEVCRQPWVIASLWP